MKRHREFMDDESKFLDYALFDCIMEALDNFRSAGSSLSTIRFVSREEAKHAVGYKRIQRLLGLDDCLFHRGWVDTYATLVDCLLTNDYPIADLQLGKYVCPAEPYTFDPRTYTMPKVVHLFESLRTLRLHIGGMPYEDLNHKEELHGFILFLTNLPKLQRLYLGSMWFFPLDDLLRKFTKARLEGDKLNDIYRDMLLPELTHLELWWEKRLNSEVLTEFVRNRWDTLELLQLGPPRDEYIVNLAGLGRAEYVEKSALGERAGYEFRIGGQVRRPHDDLQ